MKLIAAGVLSLSWIASGFLPTSTRTTFATNLASTIVTGPEGKAATTKEEDLMLTLRIIMDHAERSTTVGQDQYIAQMEALKEQEADPEPIVDVSVPYDAAAKLAYEASDKSMAYPAFKEKFEADAVADVVAKQPKKEAEPAAKEPVVDLSVPYDAAAMLAYEATDKSMPFEIFKVKYEEDAVADVIAKRSQ